MKNPSNIEDFFQQIPEVQLNYMVNISPKLDFIYFSMPKNACSTIKVLLRSLFEEDISKIKENVHDRRNSALLKPSDIGYDKFLDMLKDSDVFKFTVVRNPYSRTLSAYLDKFVTLPKYSIENYKGFLTQLVTEDKINRYIQFPDLSFLEFLNFIINKKPYYMNEHWRPQLNQGMINLITYSQIYRFEKLDDSLNDLIDNLKKRGYFTEKIKQDKFTFNPHSTQADQLIYSYYTQECLDIFNQIYAEDIEQLGYTKIIYNKL